MRSSTEQSGFSTRTLTPWAISLRLWGGTLVLMPTAIPALPLISRLGMRDGSTAGSFRRPSKLSSQSTVSFSMSASSSMATWSSRASV